MKGLAFYGVRDLRYEDVIDPKLEKATEAIVRVKAVGICGSDISRYKKLGPYIPGTVWGHEFSGEVVELGTEATNVKVGDRVVGCPSLPCFACAQCLNGKYYQCDHVPVIGAYQGGAYAEYIKIPALNLVKMPEGMTFEEGALVEPSTVVLHALYMSDIQMGDEVAVMGCGTIGLLAIQWARLFGAKTIYALDINDKKLAMAKKIGADITINTLDKDVYQEIQKYTEGVHLALEAAGNPAAVAQVLGLPRKGGSVIHLGVPYSDIHTPRFYFERIIRCHLTIKGSFNCISGPFPGKEWTNAVEYFGKKLINVEALITHKFPLREGPSVFEKIMDSREDYGKVLLFP